MKGDFDNNKIVRNSKRLKYQKTNKKKLKNRKRVYNT